MNTDFLLVMLLYRPVKLFCFMAILLCFFWHYAKVSKKVLLLSSILLWFGICCYDTISVLLFPALYDALPLQPVLYVTVCVISAVISLRKLIKISGATLFYVLCVTMEFAVFITGDALWLWDHFTPSVQMLTIVTLLISASICLLICCTIAPLFAICHDSRIWLTLSISPLIGSIGIFVLYNIRPDRASSNLNNLSCIILFTALMSANAVCAGSIRKSVLAAEYALKLKNVDELLSMQKKQYSQMALTIEQTSQTRHDLHHQLDTMSALLHAGKYEELGNYLSSYEKEVPKADILSGNAVADAVIGHYLAIARDADIDISYQLNFPAKCRIEDPDLSVIMGNCLENAVEACLKLPQEQRSIHVVSLIQGAYFGLTFENSFDGSIVKQGDTFLSIKREGKAPGIGLASVSSIVSKYNGSVEISYTEKRFRIALIMEYT